jgi:hypothetical protein
MSMHAKKKKLPRLITNHSNFRRLNKKQKLRDKKTEILFEWIDSVSPRMLYIL